MHFDDFFDFDEGVYAAKIRALSNSELKARETEKTRQVFSGFTAAGGGLGAAAATGGMSLVFTGIGARKADIAKKKLELVLFELQRRGVPLKDGFTKSDIAIPAIGGLVGLGVGTGVEGMLGPVDGAVPTTESAAGAAAGLTFGDLAVANAMGDMGGGKVEWALKQFESQEKYRAWTAEIQKSKGCKRLGGQPLKSGAGAISCDRCSVRIDRGLYGRKSILCPVGHSVLDSTRRRLT